MTVPPTRTPVRIARGSYANLTTVDALASLAEGELAFATDTDQLYVKKGAALVPVSSSEDGFSGNYNDLTNKPDIPSATSDLTNDSGFITAADVPAGFSGDYNDLTNKPSIPSTPGDIGAATAAQGALADSAIQPGDNVSELANDANYLGEAPQDGTQYVRNNGAWEAVEVPPGTIVGTSAELPGTVEEGQQWYDTDSGRLFVYTGTEWVDASPDGGSAAFLTKDLKSAQLVGTDANGDLISNDAPMDGAKYTRQNGGWSEITETGGDFVTVDYSGAAAWARSAGGSGGIRAALNVESIVKQSTGIYTVTFITPMPSEDYSITVSAAGAGRVCTSGSQTAESFSVIVEKSDDGTPIDSTIHFAAHALNALPPSKGTGADAWASTGSDASLAGSFNIAGCTSPNDGEFVYTFQTPMPSATGYSVVAMAGSASGERTCTVSSKTSNGFTIYIRNLDGVPAQNAHSVIVHATSAALPNTILKEDLLYADGRQPLTAGLQFPVAANTSTNPNTLDDYEEGTWTATLTAATSAPTTPITTSEASYTRIGNKVTVTCTFSGDDTTGASGQMRVTGLPYASFNSNGQGRSYSAAAIGGMDTNNRTVIVRTEPGTNRIHFFRNDGSNGTFTSFGINTTSNAYVGFTLTYLIDS